MGSAMVPFISGKSWYSSSIAWDTMSKVRRKATFYAHSLHVLIQLNAAAFVKFLAFPMQRLFERDVYFEITFIINHWQQLLEIFCKHYVI